MSSLLGVRRGGKRTQSTTVGARAPATRAPTSPTAARYARAALRAGRAHTVYPQEETFVSRWHTTFTLLRVDVPKTETRVPVPNQPETLDPRP